MSGRTAAGQRGIGRLYGIGVGPGDPELITVKGRRLLGSCNVVAYFAAIGRDSNARRVVESSIDASKTEIRMEFPVTTEKLDEGVSYEELLIDFYDAQADLIAGHLDRGEDVAVACEGDPLFYGSYMYLHSRLGTRYETEVVPGVTSVLAGAAALGTPLVCRDETFAVLSGMLPADVLADRLSQTDAAVIIKVGRNLPQVREAIEKAGLTERARYLERVTMQTQKTVALADVEDAPYFSIVVVPSDSAGRR